MTDGKNYESYLKESFNEENSRQKDYENYQNYLKREKIKSSSNISDKDFKEYSLKALEQIKECINKNLDNNMIQIDSNKYLIPIECLDETIYITLNFSTKIKGYNPNDDIKYFNEKMKYLANKEKQKLEKQQKRR